MTTKPLVMDLGLYNGDDTAAYLALGYRVVAVDADPSHIEAARVRFVDAVRTGDLVLEECGIAATDGDLPFHRNTAKDVLSSLDYAKARRTPADVVTFSVSCRHPRFLFERYGMPHYLKIDLEGSDRIVLDALAEFPDRPAFCSIEVNDASDFDALAVAGYHSLQLVEQSQFVKRGNPSGPFGEALGGEWVSADKVRDQYCWHLRGGHLGAPRWYWFDVHGRFVA